MLHAIINNNIVTSTQDISESQYMELIKQNDMIVDISAMSPQPTIGWLVDGNKLVPPVAPTVDANWIKVNKVLQIKAFVDDLLATVIAENIYMGISQAGKSGAVLSMANKKIEVASAPSPVSLYESLTNLTLTVTIDVLNYHIANISEYADLSPFVTEARLKNIKNKVQAFLGLPLT